MRWTRCTTSTARSRVSRPSFKSPFLSIYPLFPSRTHAPCGMWKREDLVGLSTPPAHVLVPPCPPARSPDFHFTAVVGGCICRVPAPRGVPEPDHGRMAEGLQRGWQCDPEVRRQPRQRPHGSVRVQHRPDLIPPPSPPKHTATAAPNINHRQSDMGRHIMASKSPPTATPRRRIFSSIKI